MNAKQARLSLVMGVVAALGTAAMLWAWWDSTKHFMLWVNREWLIATGSSKMEIRLENYSSYLDLGLSLGFFRDSLIVDDYFEQPDFFPAVRLSPGIVELPIWFLLGVFLSVTLLLWLFLMKRLARPRITEG